MSYPKIPLAQSVIQICLAEGLTDIIISPGSRNAPLTIGFAAHPAFRCFSIADERCAAFFALGRAQQLGRPVALLCTSGSALLNYYPAFAEAFYSEIPLVVLSADRPHDKIDIGDGQTIRQENVFANHSLYNANLLEAASPENDRLITDAIRTAVSGKGPVHINIPFEEPLYETVSEWTVTSSVFEKIDVPPAEGNLVPLASLWHASAKKLILTGANDPGSLSEEVLAKLAADPSVIIMTETTSNLVHAEAVGNIDVFITPFGQEEFETFRPDILLTFGGLIVSKRVKAWLRNFPPKQHWHVDTHRAYDTFGVLSRHIKMAPEPFFKAFGVLVPPVKSDYKKKASALKAYRQERHQAFLETAPYSDLKAYQRILESLPAKSMLQISNSAAIRYAQLLPHDPTIAVFCNRGTSGIDGSTSTALGAATASDRRTTLLTGDIGFFYDSNALWNNYIPKDFRIVLVNNGGGGIFRILPGHSETPLFNTFFETSHDLTAAHLAKMFGFGYRTAQDEAGLITALDGFFDASDRPVILEVFTPEKENDKVLAAYFKALA